MLSDRNEYLNQRSFKKNLITIDKKENIIIYFSVQKLNSEEMIPVKVYLKHPEDKSIKSSVGFTSETIPKQYIGKILNETQTNRAVILYAENVIVISAKSFSPFKFEYKYIQEPGGYLIPLLTDPDEIPGATIINKDTIKWDKFYLIVRYLTENGVEEIRKYVNYNYCQQGVAKSGV
jgi:hypothetical protein